MSDRLFCRLVVSWYWYFQHPVGGHPGIRIRGAEEHGVVPKGSLQTLYSSFPCWTISEANDRSVRPEDGM